MEKSDESGDDSDSESEPELITNINGETKKVAKEKKSKKKKKKSNKNGNNGKSKGDGLGATGNKTDDKSGLKESKSNDSLDEKNRKNSNISPEMYKNYDKFEDPYKNKRGNGQAFFTSERAANKMSKMPDNGKLAKPGKYRVEWNISDEDIINYPIKAVNGKNNGNNSSNNGLNINQNIGFRVNSLENKSLQMSQMELEKANVERTKLLEMQNFKFPSIEKSKSNKNYYGGNVPGSNGWNPYNARPLE